MINTSFPKNKIKTLLLENIHSSASSKFKDEGYPVKSIAGSLSEAEIITNLKDVRILGLRSRTKITRRVLQESKKLWAIGAFCIGTNQIDLKACADHGVAVFNAPYSNTRSVVELAMAEIILLVRNIWSKNQDMHRGIWNKSASYNPPGIDFVCSFAFSHIRYSVVCFLHLILIKGKSVR